ncbi:HprK-related kinase B [Thalassovita taeanensis]|uniref:HprK-related kinase B n=1 Tax=Thalassovita taeanensis TaxID=657014 RepID=A0A1H8ZEH4_9RHOB|nr:HprK-related kinase B [Thalassovita taeanensis]SEP62773.1 HprK-related kinase B [Thalassovita taeanensis]
MTLTKATDVLAQLDLSPAEEADPFYLQVGPITLKVLSPEPLRGALVEYFAEALGDGAAQLTVKLLPGQMLGVAPKWVEWAREPGKAGRKDAIFDLNDARLIHKVRTGVTFLQSQTEVLAFGPLMDNVSTVINFINTQVLNICQRGGWQICHAAAVTNGIRTLAIAGLSGGGKSTSILRMMDLEGTRFVTNDRLMVRGGSPVEALGIPKHPRINPGTIVGNPRLHGMLSPARHTELREMAPEALWTLEEKYDLIIEDVYGPNRVQYAAPLTDFWVLNWSRQSNAPTRVTEVALADRPDLLGAIMKSPGPFYQFPDGQFLRNGIAPIPAAYLEALQGVRVKEVSGGIDFDALAEQGRVLFNG